jgi:hypothetical protein
MQKAYMRNNEAAEYMRLNPRTLSSMRVSGTGPRFYKAGPGSRSIVLYTQDDIGAWLEERHVRSTSELPARR